MQVVVKYSKGLISGEGPHSLLKLTRLKNLSVSKIGSDLKVQGDVYRNH